MILVFFVSYVCWLQEVLDNYRLIRGTLILSKTVFLVLVVVLIGQKVL